MSENTFTETSNSSWFSRIGGSIKGILVGTIIAVIAFPVLFWNEGRAVKTQKDLSQGKGEFLHVDAATVDSANEGKLIHLTGEAVTTEELKDEALNIQRSALVMKRKVEMYQWEEKADTTKKKKVGGSEQSTTTYEYKKVWAEGRIDSSDFKKPKHHSNPSLPIDSVSWTASPISVGGFTLSNGLVNQLQDFSPLEIDSEAEIPEAIEGRKLELRGGFMYMASDIQNPQLGDVRISYQTIQPTLVSIVSQQKGSSFEAFKGDAGTSINILMTGEHSGVAMFEAAEKNNKVMTWVLRGVGFVMMFFGFNLIFKPLAVVADILPIAGTIVGVGTGIFAFLLAAPLSLITISIAWIFYRPLIGIPLLLLAGVGLFFLFKKIIAHKSTRT